jgi:hypothetical protein
VKPGFTAFLCLAKGSITRFLRRLEAFFHDEAVQYGIEGAIVEGATQSEHGVAVFYQPPGAGAFEPYMAEVLVC